MRLLLIGQLLWMGIAVGEEKPNIVFVFADQMRAQALGCMGDKDAITPNLDRLASEGLLLTNAISAQPVCTPYRAQLMTGRYGHATGVVHNDIRLPDDEIMISQALKQAGYATGYIGKWHLTGNRRDPIDAVNRRGWDYWAVRNCSHQHHNVKYWVKDGREPVTRKNAWEPTVQTDLAIEFIRKNKSGPFCLFVSFGPPHNPYKAPGEYLDRFKGKTIATRPNAKGSMKKEVLNYYAMVTSLDDCMGRIDAALKNAGVSRKTILAFSSDHGDMLGSQGHRLKQRPWEESINIPFILKYPDRIKAGQKKDWIFSSVDVMPTLLDFAGVAIPKNVQGMNYAPTFTGEATKERKAAFLFNTFTGAGPKTDWRGIRTKQYTYAYHFAGDWVLYDNKADPYQLKNLIDTPEYASIKAKLRKDLEAMRAKLGESLPLKGQRPPPIVLP